MTCMNLPLKKEYKTETLYGEQTSRIRRLRKVIQWVLIMLSNSYPLKVKDIRLGLELTEKTSILLPYNLLDTLYI
jgi:hypothetical protein